MCYKNLLRYTCGHHVLGPLHVCDLAAKNVWPNRHCNRHWRVRRVDEVLVGECPGCEGRKAMAAGEDGGNDGGHRGGRGVESPVRDGSGVVEGVQGEKKLEGRQRRGQRKGSTTCILEVDGKVYDLPPRPTEIDDVDEALGGWDVVEPEDVVEGDAGSAGSTEETPDEGEADTVDDDEGAGAEGGESGAVDDAGAVEAVDGDPRVKTATESEDNSNAGGSGSGGGGRWSWRRLWS